MSDNPIEKKGFAAFESLAFADIAVDESAVVESAKETKQPSSNTALSVGKGILRWSFLKFQWHWWWFVPTAFIACAIIGDANNNSHRTYTPPAKTAAQPVKVAPNDWQDVSTPVNTAPVDTSLNVLPVAANYNPRITHYRHTKIFDDFDDKMGTSNPKFTKADFEKYQAASHAGNLDALFIVGFLTKYGMGVKKNDDSGNLLLLLAAQKGQPDALRVAAYTFTNENAKFAYLMRAALQDDSRAEMLIGSYYYSGKIVTQDYNKALFWLKKSAEQLNPDAEVMISMMYFSGYGMAKDDHKAFEWSLKAAQQYNEQACGMVAALYYDGDVVPKDYGSAYFWLSCAKQDDKTVMNIKTTIEPILSLKDKITAAQLGSRPTMIVLAKDYYYGTDGAQKNNFEARKYMQMYGHTDDPNLIALNSSILSEMSQQDVDSADNEAKEWFKTMVARIFGPDNEKKQIEENRTEAAYYAETQPAVGSYPVLSINELRWCEYQQQRLAYINDQFPQNDTETDAIKKANAAYINQDIINKVNALVNDANSRCPTGRQYHENDMAIVSNELKDPAYTNRLSLDAQRIMLGWDQRFWFK